MPSPVNLARQWFEEVWNKKDASAIVALSAPDMKAFGADGVVRTRESFAEFHRLMLGAVPDLRATIDQSVQGRDMIAVHWTVTGTHTGTVTGLPPASGRAIELTGLTMVRVSDGLIVEGWDDYDAASLMRQLGATV
jgi:steroid delta-isomerase-like uncharacterized protein